MKEEELLPVFSRAGRIYELRLMVDFSASFVFNSEENRFAKNS